ncbi:glycosyltransferase [Frankia sp. AgKG'84/4]|uniref:glycosyltransferase n=1 Tax=Frankia sp. AgKG'84/4 TaxID=573490 RepID=UPI00200E97CA|nr:glycosyltransferase [Frankia sp. AgKG'84/4]MCL9794701.1 glycosyltransferase [Frankia sp. AgKG'84/4]
MLVDCAGARIGGAKRLLNEFDLYVRNQDATGVHVVGRDRSLTAPWLARRECQRRRFGCAVALNNVSFTVTGHERRVLLHGAQHFLWPEETRALGPRISRAVHLQARVVRTAALRSHCVIVPSTSMAERVASALPAVTDRLVVAFNPVTLPSADTLSTGDEETPPDPGRWPTKILCPIIITPRKKMTGRLRAALTALDILAAPPERIDATLLVTTRADCLEDPSLAAHPRLALIGEHPAAAVTSLMTRCGAIFFPTELESFGYPLAEGRLLGVPVIARNTAHNREIAGSALIGYNQEKPEEIAAALCAALTTTTHPDHTKMFARDPYFNLLLATPKS